MSHKAQPPPPRSAGTPERRALPTSPQQHRAHSPHTRLIPVLAQPALLELLRVLAYPKFRLDPQDQDRLLEDLLPWCESWAAPMPACPHS